MHLRGALGALAPAVLAGALVAVPQAAQASVGVGIQAGAVRLSGVAHPGESVALPAVSVVNAGTHRESIRLSIQRVSKGSARPVPASWIQIGAPVVQLGPKNATRVSLQLVVPAGAKPGAYLSDIVATGSRRRAVLGRPRQPGRGGRDPAGVPGGAERGTRVLVVGLHADPLGPAHPDRPGGRGTGRPQVRDPRPDGAQGGWLRHRR